MKEGRHNTDDRSYRLGLSDLLDQDLTSYEYYQTLPEDIRRRIKERDVASFQDMQEAVAEFKGEQEKR